MGIRKRGFIFAFLIFLLFAGILSVDAAMHQSSNVILSIGTCKVTLQDAISRGYLIGVLPTNCISTFPSVYHTADKILITISGYTMTLQEAVNYDVFKTQADNSYTIHLPSGGHLASEIEISTGKSLQDSINAEEFSAECTPGQSEIKDCDYLDNVCADYSDVTDTCGSNGYWTNPPCDSVVYAPKGTTPCGGSDIKACDSAGNCLGWSGTGCGSCPDKFGTYSNGCGGSTRYCYLGGDQGRYYTDSKFWSQWSYNSHSAVCQSDCCDAWFIVCLSWSGHDHNWQIKP